MNSPDTAADPLIGLTLGGRYRIIDRLGEGGMGIVYEAEHIVIEKRVAVKVLRDDCSSRPEVVERFRREARSASRIGHAHIVDISDFGETPDGQVYFVMEKLDGEDLANVLERERTVEPVRAVHICLQCARALGAAHSKGIVHRDMKPENIFLTTRDEVPDFVKVVDFGIAKMTDLDPSDGARKLTKTGMIFGTPEYMSPEQAAGKSLDERVDVYALGVMLYEMFAGRVPFVGDTFMGILTQHLFEEPPPIRELNPEAELSEAVENLIFHAMAKDPEQRIPSMDDFAIALSQTPEAEHIALFYEGTDRELSTSRRIMADLGPPADSTYRGGGGATRMAKTAKIAKPTWTKKKAKKRSYWPWIITLLALGGGAAAALVATRQSPEPAEAADKAATATEATAEGDDSVRLRIETKPDSAEIFVEGRGKLCLETPCTIDASRGDAITLLASRGSQRARQTITPTESTTVTLVFKPAPTQAKPSANRERRVRATKPARTTSSKPTPRDKPKPKPKPKPGGAMDLKVPDYF